MSDEDHQGSMIFNEGLVMFMEGLEVKEGSIRVMVFT